MKRLIPLGLMLVTLFVVFTTHNFAVTAATDRPTSVNIELLKESGQWKIKSSLTTFATAKPYVFKVYNADGMMHDWAIMPRGETDLRKALIAIEEDNLPPNASVTTGIVTFDTPGEMEFACHYRNHYQRGMKTPIVIK